MPFINEHLAKNKENIEAKSYRRNEKRVSRFRFDPDSVIRRLKTKIVGQDTIINELDDILQTVKADFGVSNRPLSVSLFVGPTGVGKTETVRLITEAIVGDPNQYCRIDMNTLAQEHYSAAITGAPPGYVGSKEGHTLFNIEIIEGSFSQPGIVLFDEIEKASREVILTLLNVLDSGVLTLSSGTKQIDFSNALIFMTSNIGSKEIANFYAKRLSGWRRFMPNNVTEESKLLDKALTKKFEPEFLNRIDNILTFQRLSDSNMVAVVDIEIRNLNDRLKSCAAHIEVPPTIKEYFCRDYDSRYGARDITRRIKRELEPKVARAINQYQSVHHFHALLENNQLVIKPASS